MPNYRRARIAGGMYFFTVVTFERRPLFADDLACGCLRQVWREARRRYLFGTEAACLLPDHPHCIWTLPAGDHDFSQRWNLIKGLTIRLYRHAQTMDRAPLWQPRFWEHMIRDQADLDRHLDYIHFNPVKHRYAQRPGDWRWSSFRRYRRLGAYPDNWGSQAPDSIKGMSQTGE
jgi:putative transposase